MIKLNKLKSECKTFLSKLREVNKERIGMDDELIKILYDLTLVIDDFYSQNEMVATNQNCSAPQTNAIGAKGSQMKCDVCNVFISGTKRDLDIHMNGRSHQLKCEAMRVNTLPPAVSAPISTAAVPKSVNHIDSLPVLTNKENGPLANNSGERPAVASNVPGEDEVIALVDSSKQSVTANLLDPVASTSEMVAAGASSTNGQITTKIYRKTIVVGVNGNHIPSNKGVEPRPIEILSGKRCDICNVPMPGTEDSFAEHLRGKRHQSKLAAIENEATTAPSTNGICAADQNTDTNPSEDVRIKKILETIEQMFPHSKAYLYGSWSYKLSDSNSDVNIYIDFDKEYHRQAGKAKITEKQSVLEKEFRKFSKFWKNVKYSLRSYLYPVVEAENKTYGVKCTFSSVNGSFVEGSKRLSEYIGVLPMIRDFVEFLKKWQAGSTGFQFSSYQLTILVVWYFQYRGYLPSIRMLQGGNERIMCGDAQINFNQPVQLIKPVADELKNYAEDFFDILGNQYAPARDIICPHFGKLFRRKNYGNDSNINGDNATLIHLIENTKKIHWNPPTAYMYVHDIFLHQLCPNITANISKVAVYMFHAQCKITADALKQANFK